MYYGVTPQSQKSYEILNTSTAVCGLSLLHCATPASLISFNWCSRGSREVVRRAPVAVNLLSPRHFHSHVDISGSSLESRAVNSAMVVFWCRPSAGVWSILRSQGRKKLECRPCIQYNNGIPDAPDATIFGKFPVVMTLRALRWGAVLYMRPEHMRSECQPEMSRHEHSLPFWDVIVLRVWS